MLSVIAFDITLPGTTWNLRKSMRSVILAIIHADIISMASSVGAKTVNGPMN